MKRFLLVVFVLLTLYEKTSSTDISENANSTFKPTRDWQKIEEGQSIPPGLHVRVNLQTGEKEAKLVEEEDNKKSLILSETTESTENNKLDPEELKEALKNVKGDEGDDEKLVKSKFRSYEELKKEFSELNLLIKTDIEIMTGLIENFRKFNIVSLNKGSENNAEDKQDEEILTILLDLEYLVHQYDNAQEFVKLNGFSDVIYKSLNSTNGEIRSEALGLLGSATQSNPKVQVAAIDSGSIHLLLKILTFDNDINVRSRSLYALSCLLRRFPAAQHKLIKDGGLTAFATIFDEEKEDLLKLQIKIITLIHDLLFERKDTKMNIIEEESKNSTNVILKDLKEKLRQYEQIDLEKKLVEQDWCKRILNWFMKQSSVREIIELKNDLSSNAVLNEHHDVIEKIVDTLFVLSDICKTDFQSDHNFMNLLDDVQDVYSKLVTIETGNKDDDNSQFYSSISNILKMLTEKLKGKKSKKDEL